MKVKITGQRAFTRDELISLAKVDVTNIVARLKALPNPCARSLGSQFLDYCQSETLLLAQQEITRCVIAATDKAAMQDVLDDNKDILEDKNPTDFEHIEDYFSWYARALAKGCLVALYCDAFEQLGHGYVGQGVPGPGPSVEAEFEERPTVM